jgi:hypothetical protein
VAAVSIVSATPTLEPRALPVTGKVGGRIAALDDCIHNIPNTPVLLVNPCDIVGGQEHVVVFKDGEILDVSKDELAAAARMVM